VVAHEEDRASRLRRQRRDDEVDDLASAAGEERRRPVERTLPDPPDRAEELEDAPLLERGAHPIAHVAAEAMEVSLEILDLCCGHVAAEGLDVDGLARLDPRRHEVGDVLGVDPLGPAENATDRAPGGMPRDRPELERVLAVRRAGQGADRSVHPVCGDVFAPFERGEGHRRGESVRAARELDHLGHRCRLIGQSRDGRLEARLQLEFLRRGGEHLLLVVERLGAGQGELDPADVVVRERLGRLVRHLLVVDRVGLTLGAPRRDGSPGDRAERDEPHAREEADDQVEEVHVRRSVAPAPRGVKRAAAGSAEQAHDLVVLRKAPLALLGEDEAPVRDDVVLASLALEGERVVACVVERGRETRGPNVVAASDGAVEDLDPHVPHPIRGSGIGRARAWLRFAATSRPREARPPRPRPAGGARLGVRSSRASRGGGRGVPQIVLNCSNGWRQALQ
jgi:hypothetical protein